MNKSVVNLHFQVDEEPLCGCATCKSLFIYLSQMNHKETTQSLSNELTKKGSQDTEKNEEKTRKKSAFRFLACVRASPAIEISVLRRSNDIG